MIVGTIIEVKRNSTTIPSFLLGIDVGRHLLSEHKKSLYYSSAQLTANYHEEELMGKQILFVCNFPRKQIGKMKSDGLCTAVQDPCCDTPEDRRLTSVIVNPSVNVENGSRIHIDGRKEIVQVNNRDLTWEEFGTQDIRVGTIVDCKEQGCLVDFGKEGLRQSKLICPDFVKHSGKQVLALLQSSNQCSILSVGTGCMLHPERMVENGFKLA